MKDKDFILISAVTAILALASANAVLAAGKTAANQKMEKCYGIARAGLNDCATANMSCAGSATKDRQPDAFLFVPKGLCDKITGGSLKSGNENKT